MIRQKRKNLVEYPNIAKSESLNSKIINNKLLVNNKFFTLQELEGKKKETEELKLTNET